MKKLFTIGYEGAALDDFMRTLKTAKVDVLLDVRELPMSRRKGFSKTVLGGALTVLALSHIGPEDATRNAPFGNDAMRKTYLAYATRKRDFIALLLGTRHALEDVYKSDASIPAKRAAKARQFQQLQADYQRMKAGWGGYAGYDRFFAEPLSNAHLASIATYSDFVPAFRALLAREKTFPAFYAAARRLADLDRDERHRQLKALGG